ncbi:hypothetical protein [Hymenobacter metallilatus]|uniref:Uncharacterized protein n=1 Tax=Hymenobacter metallilatus TaxID=2493666 RepID=A0A428JCS8_9BACT|nr:hypothetical protein [Hymenobacter metallilatus]RSK29851.1 hypothetical protein EI290_16070 [Hymenobacter metallilatus]
MSARLDFLARAFERLPRMLDQQVEDTVRDNTAFLEDANTAQLASGKDATGADITPEYADLTIALKQIKGQPTYRKENTNRHNAAAGKAPTTHHHGSLSTATSTTSRGQLT